MTREGKLHKLSKRSSSIARSTLEQKITTCKRGAETGRNIKQAKVSANDTHSDTGLASIS